ncbi:MAG: lipoate--protein ligase family protein [Planctomycetota bacterium]|nr:lipoate--protein ligase family protein [Planctomycetota bacterium]
MLRIDATLKSTAEHLAQDESLLLQAEEAASPQEYCRVWEATALAVVLGSSSHWQTEANVANCQADTVPILRRPSGGAAILAGPGCLMYAVVLSLELRPQLHAIEQIHRFVLERLVGALDRIAPGVSRAGTSDLVYLGQKFSGNALRCKRRHVLYHGTLLYDFPLAKIEQYLGTPPRQPDYRQGRSHGDFVRNLPVNRPELENAIFAAFDVTGVSSNLPTSRVQQLLSERYLLPEWNQRI